MSTPSQPGGYPQSNQPQANFPQAPLPPGKKNSAVLWIIGSIVVVLCGVMVTCGLGSYFLVHKARQAGLDSTLFSKNPAYAAAKLAVTMNPELETVSTDDASGTVSVREKKNGKMVTFKFDPDKKTMVVIDDTGKAVTVGVQGSGDASSVEVNSTEGSLKFGGAAGQSAPAWVPAYPGSSPQGTFSAQNAEGAQNGFTFKTPDAPEKVAAFYQDQLKSNGFALNVVSSSAQGAMIQGEDSAKKRTIAVTIGASGGSTAVNVVAVEKN